MLSECFEPRHLYSNVTRLRVPRLENRVSILMTGSHFYSFKVTIPAMTLTQFSVFGRWIVFLGVKDAGV
jgi:hypothetical protein